MYLVALLAAFSHSYLGLSLATQNSTFYNPMLPGFHPDPSCIFVSEWNNTFFCASSSFEAFPGVPIHASKDLKNWKLISNAINRPEQLPDLAITNRSTSGVWAPALRYHDGIFWILTTMVFDDQPQTNISRWDNFIVQSSNPFDATSWSDPVHFNFTGYDTSPFWDTDGAVYVTGSHAYQLRPGIDQAPIDLSTGATGTYVNIWNGTGGLAPEGPHIYHKDDWYYVMIAEGGTGLNHEETIARSRNINGPYEADPANPILTNANTSAYFQTVGHADLFQDAAGNWWGVALSTRSGPAYQFYPMGRETVLTPVTWDEAAFPVFTPVSGQESGWPFPSTNTSLPGEGPFINAPDNITFPPGSSLPLHFVHWRIPITENYVVSPAEKPSTLRLTSSKLNLTGYDGNYAGPQGQTFVGRRQVDTLFTYSVDLDFTPEAEEQEAGVSVFLTQSHNIYFGVVLLPNSDDATELIPYFRLGTTTSIPVAAPIVTPVPAAWRNQTLRLYINAANATHYTFAAGLVDSTETQVVGYGQSAAVSYGFTGTLLGVYATTNGADGEFNAYVGNWKYEGQGQIRS